MAKGGKKKGPRTQKDPLVKKEPRVSPDTNPEAILSKKPVWLLGTMDLYGPWGWRKIRKVSLLEAIHEKLKNFETMTWGSIYGPQNHFISRSSLCKEAQKRLAEKKLDDYDKFFTLRLTGKQRVWGIREKEIFKILWWDPKHEVCPAVKKHT